MDKPDTISWDGMQPVVTAALPMGVLTAYRADRFGVVQFKCDRDDDTWKVASAMPSEPDLNLYRDAERRYIEVTSAIAWRIVNHTSKNQVFG